METLENLLFSHGLDFVLVFGRIDQGAEKRFRISILIKILDYKIDSAVRTLTISDI